MLAYLIRRSRLSAGLVLLILVTPGKAAPPADMEAVVEEYQADLFGVTAFYDLNWSLSRINRLERLQHDWQGRLGALDFDALDQHGRVDYLLLRTKFAAELDDQALDRHRLTELAELIPFREQIQALEEARWRLEPVDSEKAASRLASLPDQVKQLRERLEQAKKPPADKKDAEAKPAQKPGPEARKDAPKPEASKEPPAALKPSPSLALRAANAVGSLRRSLRTWFTFYDGFTPEFSWWVRKPHEAADKALEEYAKYLREDIAGQHGKDEDPLVGDPIGEEALRQSLAAEMITYSPREAVAIGQRELAWCEAEMRKAAARWAARKTGRLRSPRSKEHSCRRAARTTTSPSKHARLSTSSKNTTWSPCLRSARKPGG